MPIEQGPIDPKYATWKAELETIGEFTPSGIDRLITERIAVENRATQDKPDDGFPLSAIDDIVLEREAELMTQPSQGPQGQPPIFLPKEMKRLLFISALVRQRKIGGPEDTPGPYNQHVSLKKGGVVYALRIGSRLVPSTPPISGATPTEEQRKEFLAHLIRTGRVTDTDDPDNTDNNK